MRVALVNNATNEPEKLLSLLADYEVTTFEMAEAEEILKGSFDLIVLSGSSAFPIMYNLDKVAPELRLIRETTTPLLGICFGAELIALAYGGTLRDLGTKISGVCPITATTDDPLFLGATHFDVYEGHRWVIDHIPDEIEVLATSPSGPEVIRHRTKPQYGFQFHPEKMLDETFGDELFHSLLDRLCLKG